MLKAPVFSCGLVLNLGRLRSASAYRRGRVQETPVDLKGLASLEPHQRFAGLSGGDKSTTRSVSGRFRPGLGSLRRTLWEMPHLNYMSHFLMNP